MFLVFYFIFFNLLKQGEVFRNVQHSSVCTLRSTEEFCHVFCWEQTALEHYSPKRQNTAGEKKNICSLNPPLHTVRAPLQQHGAALEAGAAHQPSLLRAELLIDQLMNSCSLQSGVLRQTISSDDLLQNITFKTQ